MRGLVKGNSPDYHNKNGKIYLLSKASQFFKIPETVVGWGSSLQSYPFSFDKAYAAKSLSSGLTKSNKALFTTEVDPKKLDYSYPWYLQYKIEATADVTVFICGEKIFCFERSRAQLIGLDWRNQKDIFSDKKTWFPFSLTHKLNESIRSFIKEINVDWGRIDFLWTGSDLYFLEYNANGQFMFLDDNDEYGLLDSVIAYLNK